MLKRVIEFLQENKVFYIATMDGSQPRVRPFGLVVEHEGRLYFGTSSMKPVYRQLRANPWIEISSTSPSMDWIRLTGKAVFDSNPEVKRKAFERLPRLEDIYQTPDNPVFTMFYLIDAEVAFYSFGRTEPETGRLS